MPFPAGSEPRRSTRLGTSQPVRPYPPASGSARSSALRNCAYPSLSQGATGITCRRSWRALWGPGAGTGDAGQAAGCGAAGHADRAGGTRKTRLAVEFADGCGWLIWPGLRSQPGGAQMMEALGGAPGWRCACDRSATFPAAVGGVAAGVASRNARPVSNTRAARTSGRRLGSVPTRSPPVAGQLAGRGGGHTARRHLHARAVRRILR
jgi:hypothetical protein